MLWLWLIVLTVVVTGLLAWPLVKNQRTSEAPSDNPDISVYRQQLEDLEGDIRRGFLSPEQGGAARLEIERRLLGAAEGAPRLDDKAAGRRWLPAAVIATVIPLLSFALYATLGSPELKGLAFAEQDAGAGRPDQQEFSGMIDSLAARLEQDPENIEGWRLLGRSYAALGQNGEAVDALRRALALDEEDANTQLALAENIMLAAGGTVTGEARRLFARALELAPGESGPRYYMALADFQAGDVQSAHDRWLALANEAPADAPWRESVIERLRESAARLGLEPPQFAAAQAPGPSEADIAGAAEMTDEDRTAFIRSMVERLATRLREEPGDVEGWLRLARAYGVLGETGNATGAYLAALEAAPDNAEALWQAGQAAADGGDNKGALAHWRTLLAKLDPSSADYVELESRIGELAGKP